MTTGNNNVKAAPISTVRKMAMKGARWVAAITAPMPKKAKYPTGRATPNNTFATVTKK